MNESMVQGVPPQKKQMGRPPRRVAWGAIHIRMPAPLVRKVRHLADEESLPVATLLRRLCVEELRRRKKAA
jgi:hypothetical protein